MDSAFTFTQQQTTRVLVGSGIEDRLGRVVGDLRPADVVVVHDAALGERAARIAAATGAAATIPIDGGSDAKQLALVGELAEALHQAGATRQTAVVAVGGGVVGYYACGGDAVGRYVVTWMEHDQEAVNFFREWLPELIDQMVRHHDRGG